MLHRRMTGAVAVGLPLSNVMLVVLFAVAAGLVVLNRAALASQGLTKA